MLYEEFRRRYGAAVRTKNILQPGEVSVVKTAMNAKPHCLPDSCEIPREFIRLDPWEAEYLFLVAERAKLGIVETGRFRGGSTFLMACANPTVNIYSIDMAPQDDEFLLRIMHEQGMGNNVTLIVGDSQKKRYGQVRAFDLLFIDGDHSYEGCMNDLINWFPLLAPGGHVVLHDCYHGQPVMRAVADFCSSFPVEILIPAYRTSNHWWHHAGSVAHFAKPAG